MQWTGKGLLQGRIVTCNLGPTWEQKSRSQRKNLFLLQGRLEGRNVLGSIWDVTVSIYLSSATKCSLWVAAKN